MNRFRRAAAFIIIAELLIIGVMNWIYLSWEKRQGRFYRVEAERIDTFLEESDALRAAPEDIDLSQFDSIIRVSEYDPSETVNNDYLVEEAGGKQFRIEYKVEDSSRAYIFMNIGMVLKVMPVIGIPLPLMSAGGTAVLSMYTAIGIVNSTRCHNIRKYRINYEAEPD